MGKWLFAFLLLASPCRASETLSQLLSDTRVLVLDAASSTRQRFSDTQITELINQGQREAVASNHCLSQNTVFQLVPGTTYYSLPSNYLAIERVTVGSLYIPAKSVAGLDGSSRGWEVASGHPTYYFINFSSRGLVGFAPWPATAADTDTVKVEYDIQPTDLVNSTDLPYNGISELQDYHHILPYFAASILENIEGLSAQATNYMSVFQNGVTLMNKHCVEQPAYRPSASGSQ